MTRSRRALRGKQGIRSFDGADSSSARPGAAALVRTGMACTVHLARQLMLTIAPLVMVVFLVCGALTLHAQFLIPAFFPSYELETVAWISAVCLGPGCVWMLMLVSPPAPHTAASAPRERARRAVLVLMAVLAMATLWLAAINIGLSYLCHQMARQHHVERLEVLAAVMHRGSAPCRPLARLQGDLLFWPRAICRVDDAQLGQLRPGVVVRMKGYESDYGFVMERYEIVP